MSEVCFLSKYMAVLSVWVLIAEHLTKSFDFRFQFGDPRLKLLDQRRDLPLREPGVNVLLAVHVPRFDGEQNHPLHLSGVRGVA